MSERFPKPPEPSISHPRPDWEDESFPNSRVKMAGNATIEGFFTLVLRGLKWYQEEVEKKPRELWVPMLMGYPEVPLEQATRPWDPVTGIEMLYYLHPFVDLITYKVRDQQPGGIKEPFGAKRERTPHEREVIKNAENPKECYVVHGQWMDNLVQFDIWASNGRAAERRVGWFKNVMERIKGSIKRQGVQQVLFWERLEDNTVTKWRSDIAVRSLRYYVRTEEITITSSNKIENIDVYANVQYSLNEAEDELAKAYLEAAASGWITPDPSGLTFSYNVNASGWPIAPAHSPALTGTNYIDED